MDKALNYSRLKLLGEKCEPKVTLQNMADALGRSYPGFLKALPAGTIYAHELAPLAELLNVTVPDLFDFLENQSGDANEDVPAYIRKRRLADVSDPLEWLRLAMSKSTQIDKVLEAEKQ